MNFPLHKIFERYLYFEKMKSKIQEYKEEFTEQIQKEKKIKQEINRLKKLCKDFDKEKIKTLEGLINEVSFLKVTLEYLRDDLLKNGLVELFEQGPNQYNRERPEVKIYNSFFKSYSSTMKQLIDLLPKEEQEEQKEETNELMQFIARGKIK